MKIGELRDRCGNCTIIDYCAMPFETPHLCANEKLGDVGEEIYREIAESITEDEIEDRLKRYKKNGGCSWNDNRRGAIYDIALDKLYRNEVKINE